MFQFALASLVLIAIPGPDQALILRNALVGGRGAGLRTMLGGASGLMIHATAAVVGISAILATTASAFMVLKLAGAAYLLYLGFQMLRGGEAVEGHRRTERPYAQGLMSNVLNPKVALFFLTFLPQFLPAGGATAPRAFALSLLFATLYLAWFVVMVLAADGLRVLHERRVQRRMELVSGGALVGFAGLLVARH